MIGRKILIHGEARKNKSYRKKYFALSIGPNYTDPRLDYFSNIEKWNQHKDEILDGVLDSPSFRSIDLSNLFFVDYVYRSKPKHGGLNLFKEDRHVILVLSSDEQKKKWREIFDNIIYKNGKIKMYPKIECTIEVNLRIKPKENIDKAILQMLKGDFRACFLKTSVIFVNKCLESPNFTIQYPFIRQWESRFDGTFRLEIGRAALIGECILILQMFDYAESKAAHSMLTNCIKCFKMSRPEPPRLRSGADKSSNRNSSFSYCRQSSIGGLTSTSEATRSESCIGFSRDSCTLIGSQTSNVENIDKTQIQDEASYMEMSVTDEPAHSSKEVLNYFEHISRIYKCPICGYFTKVVTFCSRCTSTSSADLHVLCKTEALPNVIKTKLLPSIRGKAQSLTEKPALQSLSLRKIRQKQSFSDPSKSSNSQTSQSSSKTSTNEMSSNSKLESQNSLPISANRHDDDIFMELDFDNLEPLVPPTSSAVGTQAQLKCGNCFSALIHRSPTDVTTSHRCTKCSDDMMSLTMLIEESDCCNNDWIPRTTSFGPNTRSSAITSCNSEYVEVNHNEVNLEYMDNFCS